MNLGRVLRVLLLLCLFLIATSSTAFSQRGYSNDSLQMNTPEGSYYRNSPRSVRSTTNNSVGITSPGSSIVKPKSSQDQQAQQEADRIKQEEYQQALRRKARMQEEYEAAKRDYEKKCREVEAYNAEVAAHNAEVEAHNAQLQKEREQQSRSGIEFRKPYLGESDPNRPFYERHPAER